MKVIKPNSLLGCVLKCQERALRRLRIKYEETPTFYHVKVINDIIFNEESHFIAMFKEYLLYEEINEFIKKYYNLSDSNYKINRILQFYEKYSKIYPNYTQLPQSKYIYKNIKRKQKMIDNMKNESDDKYSDVSSDESYSRTIFKTKIMSSINNITHSDYQNSLINDKDNNNTNRLFLSNEDYSSNKDKENDNDNDNDNDNEDDNDVYNSVITILERITKAENLKEQKDKDVIGIKIKSIEKANIVSPQLKSKAIDIKGKIIDSPNLKDQCRPFPKNKLLSGDSLKAKFGKMLFTTNAGSNLRSNVINKSKRIVSFSPVKDITGITTRSLKQSKLLSNNFKSNSNSNIINAYYNHSNTINQRKQSKYATTNSSNLSQISSIAKSGLCSQRNSKLCSPRNSGIMAPLTQNNSLERKSLSIQKNNSNIPNVDVNIVNHIQPGSTQINIYNGNILLKSLKLSGKSAIRSSSNSSLQNIHKEPKKLKPKFDLNFKKILHKNIIEGESITDRNCRINFFEKEGMNIFNNESKGQGHGHCKVNSIAGSKISATESRSNSQSIQKNMNNNYYCSSSQNKNIERERHESIKQGKNIICKNTASSINTNNNNNRPNSRIKLKDLYEMNIFMKNNNEKSSQLLSERNKMKKLNFK